VTVDVGKLSGQAAEVRAAEMILDKIDLLPEVDFDVLRASPTRVPSIPL
jgi:hypothetical protein